MGKHLVIRGKVQGVGYRAAFEREALALGLAGWVRNRRDGSVEAQVSGEAAALVQIAAWAHQGPASAVVSDVEIRELEDVDASAAGFTVRPTE